MKSVCILIPTYKPESSLVSLVRGIKVLLPECKILLVRDGVDAIHHPLFQELNMISNVLTISHSVNLGKGRALKTGFNEILCNHPEITSVITADADGQHLPEDIVRVANATGTKIVMGGRFFEKNKIPLKSSIGNGLTRFIFRFFIGLKLNDTQTGLRGFPVALIPKMMTIPGERYEFETSVLIFAKQNHWPIEEIPIQTIYINQNRGSHFNPILDSMRIYFLIFRFFISSIASSLVDFLIFSILISGQFPLYIAFCGARLVSGAFNFSLNKRVVFRSSDSSSGAAVQYWLLVIFLGTLSFLGIRTLVGLGMNVYVSKLLVEGSLFIISFTFQRDFIFNRNRELPQ